MTGGRKRISPRRTRHRTIALPVLRKLEELARAGAVIIGPRPETNSGLRDWQTTGDRETKESIQRLWPALVPHVTAADWLKHTGLPADCSAVDEFRLD